MSETGTGNGAGDPTRPSVKDAAARVRARRQPGTAEERARWRERKARARAARRDAPADDPEPEARAPYQADPVAIAATTLLARTLWRLSCLITKHRELSDEEAGQLGAALDPVLYKYLPALEDWQAELNLAVTVYAIWGATVISKAAPGKESGASEVSETPGASDGLG